NLEKIEPLHRAELQPLESLARLEDDQVGTFYLSTEDVAVLSSKCRPQSSAHSRVSSSASDSAQLALRAQLTNGELPSFRFPAPTPPKLQPVEGDRLGHLMTKAEVLIVTAAQIELD